MTVETDIKTLLNSLVSSRVFPDVAPNDTARPYITYTQVSGRAVSFMDNTLPSKKHGRFQVNVWSATRMEAASIILAVEAAFAGATAFQASAEAAAEYEYEDTLEYYGARQDFSVWSNR